MARHELTTREQANVRVVLRALSVRHGGMALFAARFGLSYEHMRKVLYGVAPAGAATAIRVAHAAGVPVDDVLSGRYPGSDVCRHCGHAIDGSTDDEETTDAH